MFQKRLDRDLFSEVLHQLFLGTLGTEENSRWSFESETLSHSCLREFYLLNSLEPPLCFSFHDAPNVITG